MAASPAGRPDGRSARLIRSARTYTGKQGLTYTEGVFSENTGAQHICLHLLQIPPGGRATAHLHANHETAIYLLRGDAIVLHGDGLAGADEMHAGDFLYIPADVPHLPMNPSRTETAVAILARTDPNEQESVVLLPELEAVATAWQARMLGEPRDEGGLPDR